jgi:hypothetical protein
MRRHAEGKLPMKSTVIVVTAALALGAVPAAAQATIKMDLKGPSANAAPAAAAPATNGKVPFGCEARAPAVCNFRIFYYRGSRDVVLPAGMKQWIPEVRIDKDTYCVESNKKPVPKCARKVINAKYNS